MPVNLRHLILAAWEYGCQPNWSVLQACTKMEHLTVPPSLLHTEELRTFVRAAGQLHILDCFGDTDLFQRPLRHLVYGPKTQDSMVREVKAANYRGTRLS